MVLQTSGLGAGISFTNSTLGLEMELSEFTRISSTILSLINSFFSFSGVLRCRVMSALAGLDFVLGVFGVLGVETSVLLLRLIFLGLDRTGVRTRDVEGNGMSVKSFLLDTLVSSLTSSSSCWVLSSVGLSFGIFSGLSPLPLSLNLRLAWIVAGSGFWSI